MTVKISFLPISKATIGFQFKINSNSVSIFHHSLALTKLNINNQKKKNEPLPYTLYMVGTEHEIALHTADIYRLSCALCHLSFMLKLPERMIVYMKNYIVSVFHVSGILHLPIIPLPFYTQFTLSECMHRSLYVWYVFFFLCFFQSWSHDIHFMIAQWPKWIKVRAKHAVMMIVCLLCATFKTYSNQRKLYVNVLYVWIINKRQRKKKTIDLVSIC